MPDPCSRSASYSLPEINSPGGRGDGDLPPPAWRQTSTALLPPSTQFYVTHTNHLSKHSPIGGRGKVLFFTITFPTANQLLTISIPVSTPNSAEAAEAAVSLVLLPIVGTAKPMRAATLAAVQALQQRLGSVIQVLLVDENSHPTVVRSFQPADLPAFVLVRQGAERWRQQGLPEDEFTVPQLLAWLALSPTV